MSLAGRAGAEHLRVSPPVLTAPDVHLQLAMLCLSVAVSRPDVGIVLLDGLCPQHRQGDPEPC